MPWIEHKQGWSARRQDTIDRARSALFWAATTSAAIAVVVAALGVDPLPSAPAREMVNFWPAIENTSAGLTFHGARCTDRCQGHLNGYCWARENSISELSRCKSNSKSFTEGCHSFVSHGGHDDDQASIARFSIDELCRGDLP